MSHRPLRLLCGEQENYSAGGLQAARELGLVTSDDLSQEAFERLAPQFDVLLVRLRLQVPERLVRQAPGLRAVVSPTTGLNHLDMAALEERGIRVFHLRGEVDFLRSITSTAEHTWALLLALVRRLPRAVVSVQSGSWEQRPFRGRELKGKTLGVLGHGRLGRMVARYGQAFGMTVLAYDPVPDPSAEHVTWCDSMAELLQRSEVLSVHVPLNEKTDALLDEEALGRLPRGAILVNTSRGELVDERAIVALLHSGHLGGYAADVLAHEHQLEMDGHPLVSYARTHDNVIITPHIGGAAEEAIEATDRFVLDKLRSWLEQENAREQ